MWPDLAKFRHFGNKNSVFDNCQRVHLVFGKKIWTQFGSFYVIGQIFIALNCQTSKKWSCHLVNLPSSLTVWLKPWNKCEQFFKSLRRVTSEWTVGELYSFKISSKSFKKVSIQKGILIHFWILLLVLLQLFLSEPTFCQIWQKNENGGI